MYIEYKHARVTAYRAIYGVHSFLHRIVYVMLTYSQILFFNERKLYILLEKKYFSVIKLFLV